MCTDILYFLYIVLPNWKYMQYSEILHDLQSNKFDMIKYIVVLIPTAKNAWFLDSATKQCYGRDDE